MNQVSVDELQCLVPVGDAGGQLGVRGPEDVGHGLVLLGPEPFKLVGQDVAGDLPGLVEQAFHFCYLIWISIRCPSYSAI